MPGLAIPKLQISMADLSRATRAPGNEDVVYLILVGVNGDQTIYDRLEPQSGTSESFGWKTGLVRSQGSFVIYEERLAELQTAHLRLIFGRSQGVPPIDLARFSSSLARDDATSVALRAGGGWLPPLPLPPLPTSILDPDQLIGEFTLSIQHDSGQLRPRALFGTGAQPVRDSARKANTADFLERLKRFASGDPSVGLVAEWDYAFELSAASDAVYHTRILARLLHTATSRLEG